MTSLWHLHEPGILHNLHGRFQADQPYTFVAHLLIAVNPLKPTPNPAMEDIGAAKSLTCLAPHQYVIAHPWLGVGVATPHPKPNPHPNQGSSRRTA